MTDTEHPKETDEKTSSEGAKANSAAGTLPKEQPTRRRRWPLIWVIVFVLLLIWYLVSDRLTPFTSNARVMAYVVPIVTEVSGYVNEVHASKNAFVEQGETLFQIDATRFELARNTAVARLDLAHQAVREQRASVKAARAKLVGAKASHKAFSDFSERVMQVGESGAIPAYQVAVTQAELTRTEAQLENARAELELALERLGSDEENGARIRSAKAELERANLDLSRTTVTAPVDGHVGTLKIDEGHYAQNGQPVMSLIASDEMWIEAYMTENNLGRISVGDRVDLVFDIAPGRVFKGKVASLGEGVSSGKAVDHGSLPAVAANKGWLRSPQRFPVIIKMIDTAWRDSGELDVKIYSQVDVLIYTGDHPLWNALGRFWMWLMKWFSYAY